ncbi:phosphoglycerate kinase [Thermodesulfitimonas autotrophica]|uniref:Phosphoglycerate kinase n=1 Tax=Thermodesulfitimonas autotrophica TaxID=1894989 RepID=A0A3N5BST0_9THEO|nr:phosphoglycerate kinase [Thermodesulfitimonas autotrophica]
MIRRRVRRSVFGGKDVRVRSVRELSVTGKRVLVRVDFNVPLAGGTVADDTRIRAALPTISYLCERGAVVILASHLGRPKGRRVEELRLDPVAATLERLLGRPVRKVNDCVGAHVEAQVAALGPGEILLLENVRFYPEEEANDPSFARALARLADLFVNDAFGVAHRANASTVGVAAFLPAAAGFLLERELAVLEGLLGAPARPFVVVAGGAKVADKIGVLSSLMARADALLIGGKMAAAFWSDSAAPAAERQAAQEILARAAACGVRLLTPVDAAGVLNSGEGRRFWTAGSDALPAGGEVLDIGPETAARFSREIGAAATVFWNGPVGKFEEPPFDAGTKTVARAVAAAPASVVGGGDTAAAARAAGVAAALSHISTGGGATLKFLAGEVLPAVAALASSAGAR